MAFDIYQQMFDRDGLPFEKKAGAGLPIPLPDERSENAQQFHDWLKPRTASNNRKKTRKRK